MTAKNQPIGQKPTRGRPALAKKWNERQDNLKRFADYDNELEPAPAKKKQGLHPELQYKPASPKDLPKIEFLLFFFIFIFYL